jgi:hypothetical protein
MHAPADTPVRLMGDERAEVGALPVEKAEAKRDAAYEAFVG